MAGNPLVDLTMAAALIKATQPQAFQQLCDAIRAYEVSAITEMLGGDAPHDVFRAQGKVKSIQQLRKHLVECAELRNTYVRRETDGRPTA